MNGPCTICKKWGARPFVLASGATIGRTCESIECRVLLFQDYTAKRWGCDRQDAEDLADRISARRGFDYSEEKGAEI